MYDPAIGRFTGVDPISDQFAWVSTYNYAENSPIANIDLWGLQAFSIHGTASDPSTFTENPETVKVLQELTGHDEINTEFSWEGLNDFDNDQDDRGNAADNLAEYVMQNLKDGEDITLIGHSHGGNVSIQAVNKIQKKLDEKKDGRAINLVTIATPAYNGKNDPENPANANTDSHLHFFSDNDMVQTTLANGAGSKNATRTYDNAGTQNTKVKDYTIGNRRTRHRGPAKVYNKGPVDSHSIHFFNPKLLLNKN